MVNHLPKTGPEIINELKKFSKYKGMSTHAVRKYIGGGEKLARVSELRDELEKIKNQRKRKSVEYKKKPEHKRSSKEKNVDREAVVKKYCKEHYDLILTYKSYIKELEEYNEELENLVKSKGIQSPAKSPKLLENELKITSPPKIKVLSLKSKYLKPIPEKQRLEIEKMRKLPALVKPSIYRPPTPEHKYFKPMGSPMRAALTSRKKEKV